ncbi:MAG: 3'-5' exonuclease [Clostridia bacterium]|nr:3'-5' exonuclease [Clostridia bacterium]
MRYVFFDIECACVYKSVAKMCAFGYVVTDESFNVQAREDILLNPKGKFHLTDRKGKEGLVLPYEYEDFKKYPVFREEYGRIRALLESRDALVLGHATMNDVNYLNLETKRYKLPSFNFSFLDTQFLYMNSVNEFNRQFGLGTIAEALGVEFTPHRAVDDAYATMMVCRALCEREETDVAGLVERYGVKAGKISNYKIEQGDSVRHRGYIKERDAEREQRAKAHVEFYRYINKHMHRRKKGGELEGKVFCFAKDVEDDVAVSVKLAAAIFASGGKYTSHPAECDVYIARAQGGVRYQNAVEGGAAFIPLDRFEHALEGV